MTSLKVRKRHIQYPVGDLLHRVHILAYTRCICVCVWGRGMAAMRPQLLDGVGGVGVGDVGVSVKASTMSHIVHTRKVCARGADYTAMSYLLGVFDQPTHKHEARTYRTHTAHYRLLNEGYANTICVIV